MITLVCTAAFLSYSVMSALHLVIPLTVAIPPLLVCLKLYKTLNLLYQCKSCLQIYSTLQSNFI